MKTITVSGLLGVLFAAFYVEAVPASVPKRDVDTRFPYKGPAVPVGDFVDPTFSGNGKGFPRLVEPPAVTPGENATNNINVISISYIPNGVNIHYQTPFGLGQVPIVHWGNKSDELCNSSTGASNTYDRTPACSQVSVTQCSQFFHNVQISNLEEDTTYFYQIPAANGTTMSHVLNFTTARTAGNNKPFTIAVLNDMGYTNAHGTFKQLNAAVDEGLAFAWHGGDLSYADDWYSGILPCASDWPVCYNGTSTDLPGSPPDTIPAEYLVPLPEGEVANQGGPNGGDMSVLYESNWDLWQQWMNNITTKIPYMTLLGNHEASCGEFDGPNNELSAYLDEDMPNSTAPESTLTYYSCPPSQRNFTAYQHRFRMPGNETGGVGNFWYSFDYGMAHFISLDGETDFAFSPSWPFLRDAEGKNETLPTEEETEITDSGPFGAIDDNAITDNTAYEQYQWLVKDLAAIDKTKTPWIVAMSHRPMYSTQTAEYQSDIRSAWQTLLLNAGVDIYLSGHIHWYERLFPLTSTGKIDTASIINNNTYQTNPGVSMTHIINGMAGNVESHSTLDEGEELKDITAVLDDEHYGFSKLTFHNETVASWEFVKGDGAGAGDSLVIVKKGAVGDVTVQ